MPQAKIPNKGLFSFLILGLLAFGGCGPDRKTASFHFWGFDDAAGAKAYLDNYNHVLIARIKECGWEDKGPNRETPYHVKATVIKSYKGGWQASEIVSFCHYVDASAPSPAHTNSSCSNLLLILCNEHTNTEIVLDTGDFGYFDEEVASALECVYPQSHP
jgi:hypothetical protein